MINERQKKLYDYKHDISDSFVLLLSKIQCPDLLLVQNLMTKIDQK